MQVTVNMQAELDIKRLSSAQIKQMITELEHELTYRTTQRQPPKYLDELFANDFDMNTQFAEGLRKLCFEVHCEQNSIQREDEYLVKKDYRPTLVELSKVKQSRFMQYRGMGRMKWIKAKDMLKEYGFEPIEDAEG